MRRFLAPLSLGAALALGVGAPAFLAAPASAAGPQGAIVTANAHVCGDSSAPNVGPGGSCTYVSTVAGGYNGVGPFTITATQGNVTVFSTTCASGAQCGSPTGSNPIPAGSSVTVSASGNGGVAAGSATGT